MQCWKCDADDHPEDHVRWCAVLRRPLCTLCHRAFCLATAISDDLGEVANQHLWLCSTKRLPEVPS